MRSACYDGGLTDEETKAQRTSHRSRSSCRSWPAEETQLQNLPQPLPALRSGRALWAASSTMLLPAGKVGSLCPLTGLQGQGPHSLSTKELRLQPWSVRPTCPHEGPGRHSTGKPELPLTRACIRVSCLSQESFLRSLAPLWEDGGDGGLLLPSCPGAQVPAPFTASSPALSSQSGFSSPN